MTTRYDMTRKMRHLTPGDRREVEVFREYLEDTSRLPRDQVQAKWGAYENGEPYSKDSDSDSKNQNGLQAKACNPLISNENLAEWTGLEPATPGVTGRGAK